MAAPVLVVVRLNAAAVDPATVAYLRDLVGALNGKTFQLACDSQIAAAAAADNDAGMFRLRPEPSLLAGVPDNVASAINALEKLLRKGSPALAAYERHATFLRRARQEEAVGAAMADVVAVNNLINDLQDALDARRVQLSTKSQIFAEITAAARSPAVNTEESRSWAAAELAALLPRLRQAQERETEVEMAMARMMPSFLVMFWHLEIAKARAEAADAALDAIPEMPSNWMDDFQVVRDGAMRFEESVGVLREYMA
uniref:Uncharacterized protein n=1 Tax=Oryza rufipogon TaxID=4529 RepID=A0A0E0RHN6_ORYRU